MTKEEIEELADTLMRRMDTRYVTHDQQKDKIEKCFAFDCTDAKARDRNRSNAKFLDKLHEGSEIAGRRFLMWLIAAAGVGALTAIFGPGWIDKIKGG